MRPLRILLLVLITLVASTLPTFALPNDAEVVAHTLPHSMSCGSVRGVTVSMKNVGTSTWTRSDGYKLGAVDDSDPFTSDIRDNLPAGVTVSPGQSHTFAFTLGAPSAPGIYLTDWRMLQEAVDWFGEIASSVVVVTCPPVNDSLVVFSSFPESMDCGERLHASLAMKNTGTAAWSPITGHALAALGGSDPFVSRVRIPIPSPTPPGNVAFFVLPLEAPDVPGIYVTDWQMAEGWAGFFGQSFAKAIVVTCVGSGGP